MTGTDELPRGVRSVLEAVDGEVSKFDAGITGAPLDEVYEGVPSITAAVRELGLGSYSERTIRRKLQGQQIPARKLGNVWTTTRTLLEGVLDAMTRAHAAEMCTCGICPHHARKRRL